MVRRLTVALLFLLFVILISGCYVHHLPADRPVDARQMIRPGPVDTLVLLHGAPGSTIEITLMTPNFFREDVVKLSRPDDIMPVLMTTGENTIGIAWFDDHAGRYRHGQYRFEFDPRRSKVLRLDYNFLRRHAGQRGPWNGWQ